jgi:NADPH2:quinone reductase
VIVGLPAPVLGAQCTAISPVPELEIGPIRLPPVGPGDVDVDVIAAGANFADGLMTTGAYQIRPPLPFVPGGEFVGVVRSAGGPAGAELVGRTVIAMTLTGGFAQRVVVEARACVPVTGDPYAMAGFAQSYATAHFALFVRGEIVSGDVVAVTGAGSGVGAAAVRLAAHAGARVIGIASSAEKRAAAMADGATASLEPGPLLKEELRQAANGYVDVVLDMTGGDHAPAMLRSLGFGGRYVVVGFASGTIPSLPLNHVLLRNRSVVGAEIGSWARRRPEELREVLSYLVELAEAGQIRLPAPVVYPLAQAANALDDLLQRRIVGRAVIDVDSSREQRIRDKG